MFFHIRFSALSHSRWWEAAQRDIGVPHWGESLLDSHISDCTSLTCLIWTAWFQALHSALHMFDMMESVLVRIEELTEAKENLWRVRNVHGNDWVTLLRISALFLKSRTSQCSKDDLEEGFLSFITFFVAKSKPVDGWRKESLAFKTNEIRFLFIIKQN